MQFNVQNLFRFTKSVRAFLLVTAAAAVYLFFGPAAPSRQIFFAPSNTIGGLWEEIGWAKAFFPSADCVDAAEPVCMAEFFLNVTKARRARFDSGEVPPSLQTQDNGLDWNLLFALAEGGQPDVALSFSASLEQVSQPKEEAHQDFRSMAFVRFQRGLAYAYQDDQMFDEAVAMASQIVAPGDRKDAYLHIALREHLLGRNDRAYALLPQFSAVDGKNLKAASTCQVKLGLALIDAGVQGVPETFPLAGLALIRRGALKLARAGSPEKALDLVSNISPKFWPYFADSISEIIRRTGDIERAINVALLDKNPDGLVVYLEGTGNGYRQQRRITTAQQVRELVTEQHIIDLIELGANAQARVLAVNNGFTTEADWDELTSAAISRARLLQDNDEAYRRAQAWRPFSDEGRRLRQNHIDYFFSEKIRNALSGSKPEEAEAYLANISDAEDRDRRARDIGLAFDRMGQFDSAEKYLGPLPSRTDLAAWDRAAVALYKNNEPQTALELIGLYEGWGGSIWQQLIRAAISADDIEFLEKMLQVKLAQMNRRSALSFELRFAAMRIEIALELDKPFQIEGATQTLITKSIETFDRGRFREGYSTLFTIRNLVVQGELEWGLRIAQDLGYPDWAMTGILSALGDTDIYRQQRRQDRIALGCAITA